MKKFLILFALAFTSNLIHAQWKEIPGLYLESAYVGMDAKQIIAEGDMLFAIMDNTVCLSYNNGKSWMRTTGYNGYANCVTALGSELFVGGSGVWFSDNFGASYQARNKNLPKYPRILAILATDSVLVAAVTSSDPVSVWDAYISFDKGINWSITNGLTDKYIQNLASDGLILYAGTQYGVYRSLDNGRNWTSIGLADKSIYAVAAKGDKIYAGENNSDGLLYVSMDKGITWNPVPGNGLTTTWFNSILLKDQYIFVASLWDGVFRSANSGTDWLKTSGGITTMPVYSLALQKNQLLAGTLNGIATSGNNGTSWNQPLNTYNLQVMDIGLSGKNLLATTDQGTNRTDDQGVSWDREFISMQIIACEDSMVYLGSEKGFYHSSDYGESLYWYDVRGLPGEPGFTDICASDSLVFGSLYDHGIYFSADRGITWSERNSGLLNKNIIALTLSDSMLFAASDTTGIFLSDDLGLNWDPEAIGPENQHLTCLSNYRNYLFAGTADGGFFKSDDRGRTWSNVALKSSNTAVNCIYTYGNNVFAGIEANGLYLSLNNGENWVPCNEGLIDFNINSIDGNNKDLYIGSKGGAVWTRKVSEIPLSLSVKEIKADKKVICEEDSVQLTASVIGGTPPYQYKWNDGQSENTIRVKPAETGWYVLQVTDNKSDTASLEVRIWVNQKPEAPTLSLNGDTLISSAESGNLWYFEGEFLYGINTNKFLPQSKGHFSAKVSSNGCLSEMSQEVPYGLLSSESPDVADGLEVYPNPAHDKLIIKSPETVDETTVEIVNIKGETILQQKISEREFQIDVSQLNPGDYYFKISNNKQSIVKKVIIQ
jgi:photosystem II stability/assembly factor-like uncharacterized protein